jgi:biofilm PGA synthesis N-glycosyltransferase PgaC
MKPAQDHHGLVLVASGCFSIFKTETVRRFGGFNERTLAEDLDLTWEIQNEGGRVYFASRAVCYPIDPHTARVFVNQMNRWYRGFMQNLKVRRFNLFPHKRSMAVMTYGYLAWNIGSVLFVPGLTYGLTGNVLVTLVYVVGVTAVFGWLPALLVAWKLGVFRDALGGLVPFMILPYLNLMIYLKAFVQEIILGQSLREWKKGH